MLAVVFVCESAVRVRHGGRCVLCESVDTVCVTVQFSCYRVRSCTLCTTVECVRCFSGCLMAALYCLFDYLGRMRCATNTVR